MAHATDHRCVGGNPTQLLSLFKALPVSSNGGGLFSLVAIRHAGESAFFLNF
jgi:hypothetical protein